MASADIEYLESFRMMNPEVAVKQHPMPFLKGHAHYLIKWATCCGITIRASRSHCPTPGRICSQDLPTGSSQPDNGLLRQRRSGSFETKIDQVVNLRDANTHDTVRATPVDFHGAIILGDCTAGKDYIVNVTGQLPRILR
jgi:hypothetical protein